MMQFRFRTNQYSFFSMGKSKLPLWEVLLLIFFAFYYLLPAVTEAVPFMVALAVAVVYLLLLFIKGDASRLAVPLFLTGVAWISLLFLLLTDTQSISQSVENYTVKVYFSKINQMLFSFFPIFMLHRLVTGANKTQLRLCFWLLVAIVGYVIVNTTIELLVNEDATRSWANFEEQAENNVGTYAYVYAVPMIITALVSQCMRRQKMWQKLLIIALIAFLFLFLTLAQYTLALLISCAGVALQLNFSIRKTAYKVLLWLFFAVLLLFLPNILRFLAENIQSEQMQDRLTELAAFFDSGDTSGYNFNGRLTRYIETIKAFFRSPIWGNRSLPLDGHATFLTLPADVGLLGAIPFFAIIHWCVNRMKSLLPYVRKEFIPLVVCYVLMGLTNPIHSALPLSIAMWLVAPLILFYGVKTNET